MSDKSNCLQLANGVFLDVQSAGSSVRFAISAYRQNGKRYFDGEVQLRDCDKSIRWSGFGGDGIDALLKKLTNALCILGEAQGALLAVKQHYDTLAPKRKRK